MLPFLLAATIVNFDAAPAGSLPSGWSTSMTHAGGPPKWQVIADPTAPSKPNVLAQLSNDPTDSRFPLAVYEKASFQDGALSVRFKTVSGTQDQAAGLVFRYQDPNNYYIVRANALEDNVVFYKVEKGQRIPIAPKGTAANTYGAKHPVPKRTWSTLAVAFKGKLFTISFNGQRLYDVEDSTFAQSGKTGLWTKADSVTSFDDFELQQSGQ